MSLSEQLKQASYQHIGKVVKGVKQKDFDTVCASIITDFLMGATSLADIILTEIKAGKSIGEIEKMLTAISSKTKITHNS